MRRKQREKGGEEDREGRGGREKREGKEIMGGKEGRIQNISMLVAFFEFNASKDRSCSLA
jgi:hypothetical protein